MAFALKKLKNIFRFKERSLEDKVKEVNSLFPINLKYNEKQQ